MDRRLGRQSDRFIDFSTLGRTINNNNNNNNNNAVLQWIHVLYM